MDHSDNDLQGTNSSGSLGGLDVRRRIPIKLISKQTTVSTTTSANNNNKSKVLVRSPRSMPRVTAKTQSGDEEGFDYGEEERYDCKSGDMFMNQRRFPGHLFWDYKINLIGEKDDTPVHFCDQCGLPIKIYGRMIPCKHVFCYDCAIQQEKKGDKVCPGVAEGFGRKGTKEIQSCNDPVQRIEQCTRGALFMCSIVQGCKRTYLSQRDLQAHINHRHMRAGKPASRPPPEPVHPPIVPATPEIPDRFIMPPEKHHMNHIPPKPPILMPPPPIQHVPHEHYNPQQEDIRPPPTEMSMAPPPPRSVSQDLYRIRKHSNLITVPIQDDSSSNAREPLPHGPVPPHHHPEYPGQPVVTLPHHIMPPQQHYAPPPPPPPPISHPMQHPPQAAAAPHLVYSQAPPPPMTSAPPPINPPPGHIIPQMPPYMNHPPPGPPPQHGGPPVNAPPPHHYNPSSLPQFNEDQGTMSPPFTQPGGMSPGMWPAPRGPPPPPRMQGPPSQAPIPGPRHPDQTRYRPYYQ